MGGAKEEDYLSVEEEREVGSEERRWGEREGRSHVHQEELLTGSRPAERMSNFDRVLRGLECCGLRV